MVKVSDLFIIFLVYDPLESQLLKNLTAKFIKGAKSIWK